MATITIRNVEDAVHRRLKLEAKANHRSLESEVRARLEWPTTRADTSEMNWADEVRRVAIDPGPGYEGSVALIRAIRDEK